MVNWEHVTMFGRISYQDHVTMVNWEHVTMFSSVMRSVVFCIVKLYGSYQYVTLVEIMDDSFLDVCIFEVTFRNKI